MKTLLDTPRTYLFFLLTVLGLGGLNRIVVEWMTPTYGLSPAVAILGAAASLAVFVAGIEGMVRVDREVRAWVSGDHPLARRQLAENLGPPLVHWTYAPDEWAAYAAREWAARKDDGRVRVVPIVVGVALALLFVGVPSWIALPMLWAIYIVGALAWPGTLVMTRQLDPGNRPPSATLAANAILFHDRRLYLEDEHSGIARVRYEDGDAPRLAVTIHPRANPARGPYDIRIPVPRGHEEEARAVAAAFPHAVQPAAATS